MYSLTFLLILSFGLSLVLTPLVRNLCHRWGLVDHPGGRKVHVHPTPRAGGVAIALSYLLAYGLLLALGAQGGHLVWSARQEITRLIPAAAIIFLVGLIDDIWSLKAPPKLLGETAAAVCAYFAGVQVTGIGGHPLDHWLGLPVTVFWLLACTNALNLIDGLDGLAAGVGVFASATAAAAALMQHNILLAIAVVPLFGALLGFLRYNFSPASIFLGDSGSLFIGFLLGCYGVLWNQKSTTLLAMTAPLMVLAVPLLDTSLAIIRRFLQNRPILSADRGHIHHRLLDRGIAPRNVVLLLYACCGAGALCSLLVMNSHAAEAALILFCAFVWAGVQHLGYLDFNRAGRVLHPANLRRGLKAEMRLHTLEKSLATAKTVEECWAIASTAARELGVSYLVMRLDQGFYEARFNEDAPWNTGSVRVPLSKTEYVNIGFDFADSDVRNVVGPLANSLRDALKPQLPESPNERQDGRGKLIRMVKYGNLR